MFWENAFRSLNFTNFTLNTKTEKMNTIKSRFNFQIDKIEALMYKAELHANPALWLFLNDLRTPMFMLEGLGRIYREIGDEDLFDGLYDDFKEVEDALGGLDHYVAMYNIFKDNKKVEDDIKDYFYSKAQEKIWLVNEVLIEGKWYSGKKVKSILKKLKHIDDLSIDDENKAIKKFYQEEVAEIVEFVKDEKFHFDDMEHDVHELRRKLRWLSIYPHALNGVIQLTPSKTPNATMKKYLTEKVVNSPYNKLPINEAKTETINIDKNTFLSLSWMIAELGALKDQGLTLHALVEAYHETSFDKDEVAYAKAYKVLGTKQAKIEDLLATASKITKDFIGEGHLERMV